MKCCFRGKLSKAARHPGKLQGLLAFEELFVPV